MVESIKKAGVLRGIREQRVDATQTLAEALQQLEYLRELWQASVGTNQLAHQEIPRTSEECYEFLGAVGFLWRSRLGRAWEVALQEAGKPTPQGTSWSLRTRERHKLVSVPESPKLLSDFEETIHWSAASTTVTDG